MATSYNSISRNRRRRGWHGSLRGWEKEESGEEEPRVSTRLGSPSTSAGISPLYEL